ncbi:hypothetical protein LBMAG53_29640 [Planctomycetota bacterium]|nr:hypothetical protein LBMAG53_29640 [Planctomycetota bacterium]
MENIRLGFVGVGGMGQMAHLRNYLTIPGCTVAAIAEIRPQTARLVADRHGIAGVYADHREMLAKEQLDGVVASQQFGHHAALLPEIYPHVRRVLTEKPLCINADVGAKLVTAAAAAGCTHMVGYHKRSDPATIWAKAKIAELTASGRLGKLTYVRILMPAGDWIANGRIGLLSANDKPAGPSPESEPRPSDLDEATYKKYVDFVNYYIHQVNLMRHLIGGPYQVTYAEKTGVLLAVESAAGIAGTIEMTPYRTTIDWQEEALVCFEKGWVRLTLPAPLATNRAGTVEVYSDPDGGPPERTSPTLPWVHAMRQQALNFVAVCRGEIAPPCAAAEAVEDLRIARDYIRLRFGV